MTEQHTVDYDAGPRDALAQVIYRELGDMVNRDYLIDALMPVVQAERAEAAAGALFAAADQVPDKTILWRVYDMTRVPARIEHIEPWTWLRKRGQVALTRVTSPGEGRG